MKTIKNISLFCGIVFSIFFVSFMVLAWSAPGSAPTGGNVAIPINESSVAQIKTGPLEVQGLFIAQSNVGIGTTSPRSKLNLGSGGIAIGSGNAVSTVHGDRRSIQIASDTSYGGTYNNHTGFLVYSTMPGGWGTGQLHFTRATNWATYDSTPTLTLSGRNVGIGITNPQARLHVSGDIIVGMSDLGCGLINAGGIKFQDDYFWGCDGSEWRQLSFSDNYLIGGKTKRQCIESGGSVTSIPEGKICRFDSSFCPSGWSQYESWSTTKSASPCSCKCTGNGCCQGTYTATWGANLNGWGDCSGHAPVCDSHSWSNTPVEKFKLGVKAGYCACYDCCHCWVYATITQIGCY